MRQKGSAPSAIARTTILRGAEVFGLGLLFRVQEFVLGQPWAPWTDLLRVDVLNVIGISLMLMGAANWLVRSREANILLAAIVASGNSWPPRLCGRLCGRDGCHGISSHYIDGGPAHVQRAAALALPYFSVDGIPRSRVWPLDSCCPATGRRKIQGARQRYRRCWRGVVLSVVVAGRVAGAALRDYDYWHTSPNFLLARRRDLLVIRGGLRLVAAGASVRSDQPVRALGAGVSARLLGAHRNNSFTADFRFCQSSRRQFLWRRSACGDLWRGDGRVGHASNAWKGRAAICWREFGACRELRRWLTYFAGLADRGAKTTLSTGRGAVLKMYSPGRARPISARDALDGLRIGLQRL